MTVSYQHTMRYKSLSHLNCDSPGWRPTTCRGPGKVEHGPWIVDGSEWVIPGFSVKNKMGQQSMAHVHRENHLKSFSGLTQHAVPYPRLLAQAGKLRSGALRVCQLLTAAQPCGSAGGGSWSHTYEYLIYQGLNFWASKLWIPVNHGYF